MYRKRRSGHCFSASPLDLLFLLGFGILSAVAPLATFIKIIASGPRALRKIADNPPQDLKDLSALLMGPYERGEVDEDVHAIDRNVDKDVDTSDMNVVKVSNDVTSAICPVCANPIGEDAHISCPTCSVPHHDDCWEYNGACAVYGCGEIAVTEGIIPVYNGKLRKVTDNPSVGEYEISKDFAKLKRRFRRWFWVRRIQWWSILCLCYSLAGSVLLYALGTGEFTIIALIQTITLVSFTGSVILWVLTKFFLWRLERSQERLPKVPPVRMTALLQRIGRSPSTIQISTFAELAPYLYGTLGLLPFFRSYFFIGPRAALSIVFTLLGGGFFIWMARSATRRHRAILERVKSRLRGSAKV